MVYVPFRSSHFQERVKIEPPTDKEIPGEVVDNSIRRRRPGAGSERESTPNNHKGDNFVEELNKFKENRGGSGGRMASPGELRRRAEEQFAMHHKSKEETGA